jgi:hypothetical protein
MFRTSDNDFENFGQPIAGYEEDGKIILATKTFRELAEITQEDIRKGRVNILDCLNDENEGISETALAIFGNFERTVKDIVRPLRKKSNDSGIEYLLSKYKNAVFFPLRWIGYGFDDVDLGAILLIREPYESDDDDG